ncbi:MAG: cyclic pyranopterin monophosphate synthase MoaC [Thaumarchaeota archaeon]|nr:cyclic pyranopterin monophosphate synthase MoaC [Nitrososphaerota archaeon]
MVNISEKTKVHREAIAVGSIRLKPDTIRKLTSGQTEKGDAIQIAKIAGIQAAKITPLLIPLCHPVQLEHVDVKTNILKDSVEITAKVVSEGKTGVEMEALTAVSVALLNIWDVVKAYEKDEKGQYPNTALERISVRSKVKK